MKSLRLILGDQLNPAHSWYRKTDPDITYVLMEVRQETDYVNHHIQKICAFFAAMRHFASHLVKYRHNVIYIALDDPSNTQSIIGNLQRLIKQLNIEKFEYQEPDEYRLDQQIADFCKGLTVEHSMVSSEHFLTTRSEVAGFFENKRNYTMEVFYRYMRRKHVILMQKKEPVGGKWNFDNENRSPYDGKTAIPEPLSFANNVGDVFRMIHTAGVNSIGTIAPEAFLWPLDPEQAERLLDHFIDHLLPFFGTYQDAMVTDQWSLYHSRLSFALNTKMLHPMDVINRVLKALGSDDRHISLSQVEGFVRQIMGWREYMRGMYWMAMPSFATLNYFNHKNPLPGFYWTGTTRMFCLAQTIKQSLDKAYAHHIQRLMITGNFALLAGIDPGQVDQWYLAIYIDAIEWVELTNTRGMSQYADGGIIATKPYVSSANYINRMSDYCGKCFYDPKKRYGERACPFNSLYWHFFHRNHNLLSTNPRSGMVYRTWQQKAVSEQGRILEQAEIYLDRIEAL
jgi:deoxyribodipyrimidine photolyase-related protein